MSNANDMSIFSCQDILDAYQNYDVSEEAREPILYFISELTGLSVDAIIETCNSNSKPESGKPDLTAFSPEPIRREAYRLYQLDWMAAHGKSVSDLGISVLGSLMGGISEHEPDDFRSWELDNGFDGELWACYNEFLDSEYKDRDYMTRLLPAQYRTAYEYDLQHMPD